MKIVVAEDVPSALRFCEAGLIRAGHEVLKAETGASAEALIGEQSPDLALIDLTLPDVSGLDLIAKLAGRPNSCPIIVITGDGSVKTAVDAMRRGARDFIVKPYRVERLIEAVEAIEVVAKDRRTRSPVSLSAPNPICRGDSDFEGFIGASEQMKSIYRMLRAVGPSTAPIFITGESGTGKELAAEAAHSLSYRRGGPFVAINCSAIPKDLVESELFGHVKGSFTGAVSDRDGACRQAHGGTLFLDEICEMPTDLQSKMLRFLQSGTIRPVGSARTEKVDVRIVCATNKDPNQEVRSGRFRADLFYRLHVVRVSLPPLRERGDDVLLLAEAFIKKYAADESKAFRDLDQAAKRFIREATWPGNVRQLQNVIRRAIVMYSGNEICAEMLEDAGSTMAESPQASHTSLDALVVSRMPLGAEWRKASDIVELAIVEKSAIERAVALCDGSFSKAAGYLGVSPSTLYRKRSEWSLQSLACQ